MKPQHELIWVDAEQTSHPQRFGRHETGRLTARIRALNARPAALGVWLRSRGPDGRWSTPINLKTAEEEETS